MGIPSTVLANNPIHLHSTGITVHHTNPMSQSGRCTEFPLRGTVWNQRLPLGLCAVCVTVPSLYRPAGNLRISDDYMSTGEMERAMRHWPTAWSKAKRGLKCDHVSDRALWLVTLSYLLFSWKLQKLKETWFYYLYHGCPFECTSKKKKKKRRNVGQRERMRLDISTVFSIYNSIKH